MDECFRLLEKSPRRPFDAERTRAMRFDAERHTAAFSSAKSRRSSSSPPSIAAPSDAASPITQIRTCCLSSSVVCGPLPRFCVSSSFVCRAFAGPARCGRTSAGSSRRGSPPSPHSRDSFSAAPEPTVEPSVESTSSSPLRRRTTGERTL